MAPIIKVPYTTGIVAISSVPKLVELRRHCLIKYVLHASQSRQLLLAREFTGHIGATPDPGICNGERGGEGQFHSEVQTRKAPVSYEGHPHHARGGEGRARPYIPRPLDSLASESEIHFVFFQASALRFVMGL